MLLKSVLVSWDVAHYRSARPNNSRTQMAKDKSFSELEVIKQAYPNIEKDFHQMFYSGVYSAKRKRPENAKDPSYRGFFLLSIYIYFSSIFFRFYHSVSRIQDGKACYTSIQKIALLWVYHSAIANYEKSGKLYNHNYLERAIGNIKTTFDITVSQNTIRRWNAASLINDPPNQCKKRAIKME